MALEFKLRRSLLLWLVLRLVSLVVVPLALYLRPAGSGITAVTSLRSFLLSPWYSWDVRYYVEIVRNGYQPGSPTANLHPLYPWISTLLAAVIREPLLSLLLVSSIAGLLLTIVFYRLARLDCNEQQAWHATALLLCWPASVALFIPYTEALFLLLSVYSLFAARHQRFWLAGLAGALATLTRQQGLFLVLPLAWEIWEASGRQWSTALRKCLPLFFVPAAYALWVGYRAVAINDVAALNDGFDVERVFIIQNPVHLSDQAAVVSGAGNVVLRVRNVDHRPDGIWRRFEWCLRRGGDKTGRCMVFAFATRAAPVGAVHSLR